MSSKKNKKQQDEKPQWQPISMIGTIGSIIDGEVENFEDLYKNLCEARKKPHVMDDMTVDRAYFFYFFYIYYY